MSDHDAIGREFGDDELLRYSRQILLPGFELEGQRKLRDARVLVIGAGGLGCPVVLYLAAAGVGHISVVDPDTVELSNLQRQVAHRTADIGRAKAESAAENARALNPLVQLVPVVRAADAPWLAEVLAGSPAPGAAGVAVVVAVGVAVGVDAAPFDCVLDCSDNFATRDAVNRACHAARVPLVSAAAIRVEGQLAVFDFRRESTPCYACLYGESGGEDAGCVSNGVLSPVVGVLGSMQALAAIRVIAGYGESGHGKLQVFDGLRGEWRTLRIRPDPSCAVCSEGAMPPI